MTELDPERIGQDRYIKESEAFDTFAQCNDVYDVITTVLDAPESADVDYLIEAAVSRIAVISADFHRRGWRITWPWDGVEDDGGTT